MGRASHGLDHGHRGAVTLSLADDTGPGDPGPARMGLVIAQILEILELIVPFASLAFVPGPPVVVDQLPTAVGDRTDLDLTVLDAAVPALGIPACLLRLQSSPMFRILRLLHGIQPNRNRRIGLPIHPSFCGQFREFFFPIFAQHSPA